MDLTEYCLYFGRLFYIFVLVAVKENITTDYVQTNIRTNLIALVIVIASGAYNTLCAKVFYAVNHNENRQYV